MKKITTRSISLFWLMAFLSSAYAAGPATGGVAFQNGTTQFGSNATLAGLASSINSSAVAAAAAAPAEEAEEVGAEAAEEAP